MLRIGHPGSSFAIEIARKIGISKDVVDYATELVGKNYIMSDKYVQDIARDKMYWETKRQKIHSQEKQLEATIANYEKAIVELRDNRKDIIATAQREAQELLRESNAQIENTIRSIKESQAEKERTREARQSLSDFQSRIDQSSDDDRIVREMEKIQRRKQNKQQRQQKETALSALTSALQHQADKKEAVTSKIHKLSVGVTVRLKGQHAIGRIQQINGKIAKVIFGVMHTNVPLERLEAVDIPKEERFFKVSTFLSKETQDTIYEKKLKFQPEIDVRGKRGDEAVEAVRSFIDDAILLEQSQVRILHGTGTGVLRQLIRQYLHVVAGVKNYRDEHVQFGGAGITVVELE